MVIWSRGNKKPSKINRFEAISKRDNGCQEGEEKPTRTLKKRSEFRSTSYAIRFVSVPTSSVSFCWPAELDRDDDEAEDEEDEEAEAAPAKQPEASEVTLRFTASCCTSLARDAEEADDDALAEFTARSVRCGL